jgi:hypothetical protein
MTTLHGSQLSDFDGTIDHGASDAVSVATSLMVWPASPSNLSAGRGSSPAVSEAGVLALTTNMDAALFVTEHRSPDGDDEITHGLICGR